MVDRIWNNIKGYEGLYQINSIGEVKSLNYKGIKNNHKLLKQTIFKNGYKYVDLCNVGIKKRFTIHRLVGITFIPNTKNKPCINHMDGNKLNNNISNLEWVTKKENSRHCFNNDHYTVKLNNKEVIEIRDLYKTGNYKQRELGEMFNVSRGNINSILNRYTWKI